MSEMRVLIVGASGFAGRAIAERLSRAGVEVAGLLRRPAEDLPFPTHVASIGDPQALAEVAEGFDVVVNAAGIANPGADPEALRWTHVAGTQNILNASHHAGVQRLIQISCADATLSSKKRVHWNEERAPAGRPFGARAQSLKLAEEIVLAGGGASLQTVVLRPGWLWGPGDFSRLPGLLMEANKGGVQLVADGKTYFSSTYVDHLAQAVERALKADGIGGRCFHVMDAEFVSVREFFGALSEALSLPMPRTGALPFSLAWPVAKAKGRGPSGIALEDMLLRGVSNLFDFSNASGALDYTAEVGLEEGMQRLAAFVQREGGVEALIARQRPAASRSDVAEQIALASDI